MWKVFKFAKPSSLGIPSLTNWLGLCVMEVTVIMTTLDLYENYLDYPFSKGR